MIIKVAPVDLWPRLYRLAGRWLQARDTAAVPATQPALTPSVPREMARASTLVRIDPASIKLIEDVGTALGDAGLENYIDELCDRGAFTESLESKLEKGVLVISLGPYTELLLREMLDVARRKGWSTRTRSKWIEQIIVVAGFGS